MRYDVMVTVTDGMSLEFRSGMFEGLTEAEAEALFEHLADTAEEWYEDHQRERMKDDDTEY